MTYTHRLATPEDAPAIAPLWAAFAAERQAADPSQIVKPGFDFVPYVADLLAQPNYFCPLLLSETAPNEAPNEATNEVSLVGFLCCMTHDEAPPPELPEPFREKHDRRTPYLPRRVGSVLGLYVQPEHRTPDGATIQRLVDAALEKAQDFYLTDLDLLISVEQTGVQALAKKLGFRKAAVQYTLHLNTAIPEDAPRLHAPLPNDLPHHRDNHHAIPLIDSADREPVRNPAGEIAFLFPLRDEHGNLRLNANGLPHYPQPVRDPATNTWAFDPNGELVLCPVLEDPEGTWVEVQGQPVPRPVAYAYADGKLSLQRDADGHYRFQEVVRNPDGAIARDPNGYPLFKNP